jgi:class 3 adenylate cyclase
MRGKEIFREMKQARQHDPGDGVFWAGGSDWPTPTPGVETVNICPVDFPTEYEVAALKQLLQVSDVQWTLLRYGGAGEDSVSSSSLASILKTPQQSCVDADDVSINEGVQNLMRCLSLDVIWQVLAPAIGNRFNPAVAAWEANGEVDPGMIAFESDPTYTQLWISLARPLYEEVFLPLESDIASTASGGDGDQTALTYGIVMAIVAEVAEICWLVLEWRAQSRVRALLLLLYHVPVQTVFKIKRIVSVLRGDFTGKAGKMHHKMIYDATFAVLPNAVICIKQDELKIEMASNSAARLLGVEDASQLVGKNLRELMESAGLPELPSDFFADGASDQVSSDSGAFSVTCTSLEDRLIVTFQDVTDATRYARLIREEREQSDDLLGQMLPRSLIAQVQAHEAISFAVQSASISFMDIVTFTPWCGSHEASYAMATLNGIYAAFDEEIDKNPLLMKLKCIGDCYMSAGGLFAEQNQPAAHASALVGFCLNALGRLKQIDEELGEKLEMRAGVHAGGPIAAGVLGASKPTFEVIGPAIVMGEQMEHTGLPSVVQITRATYELIYGGNFIVKERGETEVKGGKILTYIVSGRGEGQQVVIA